MDCWGKFVNRMAFLLLNDTSTSHDKSPKESTSKEYNDTTEEESKGKCKKLAKSVSLYVRLQ